MLMRRLSTCSCGRSRRAHAERVDELMREYSTLHTVLLGVAAGRYADSGYWRWVSTLLAGRCAAPFGIEVAMRTFLIPVIGYSGVLVLTVTIRVPGYWLF